MTGGGKDVCEQSRPVERERKRSPFLLAQPTEEKEKEKSKEKRKEKSPIAGDTNLSYTSAAQYHTNFKVHQCCESYAAAAAAVSHTCCYCYILHLDYNPQQHQMMIYYGASFALNDIVYYLDSLACDMIAW